MKTKFRFIYIFLAVLVFFSCETEQILYDSSKNHVAFVSSTTSIAEQGGKVGIPVMVAALLDDPAVTVDFTVDADQSVAKEGVDFNINNDSKTLSFPDGWGYDTIWVTPVDNDVFGGNISFIIKITSNSQGYQNGAQDSIVVTILDNEHPLGTWIGTYTIQATYVAGYFSNEVWKGITCEPDPNDVNNLIIKGLCGESYEERLPITAKVDLEEMSISLPIGADIGSHSAYGGPVSLYIGTEENGILDEEPLIGQIFENGKIQLDMLAIYIAGGTNEGLVYGVYNTLWTKD